MIFVSHRNGLECKLKTDKINAIVLEDTQEYTILVEAIWNQINKVEENLLLYGKENDLLDMSKYCDIVFSPRDLTFQNSKIQKKLLVYLTEEIQTTKLQEKIVKNQMELLTIMEEVRRVSEYPICMDSEHSILEILKGMGIKLLDPEGSFCEKFIDYAKIGYDFFKINVLFLIGCKSYLKESDYEHLRKWAEYQQITIILVENDEFRLPLGINKYILDTDKCLIH